MKEPGTGVWRKAAGALAASDANALAALLPEFPPRAAKALAAAVRKPARSLPAAPEPPEGVEMLADSRFAALFARKRAAVRWELPGRELTTGCYLTTGQAAEFLLEPGECRFIILREPGEDA